MLHWSNSVINLPPNGMDFYILLRSALNKLSTSVNMMHEKLKASFGRSLLTCINKLVAENILNLDCSMICFITTTVDSRCFPLCLTKF